jgi:hypothetical protein
LLRSFRLKALYSWSRLTLAYEIGSLDGRDGMAVSKKNATPQNLRAIAGHPGLYSPIAITRNPKKEKALWAKILRDARKLTSGTLIDKLIRS